MDKIDKFLEKLQARERRQIEEIVGKIVKNDLQKLDYKKLRGSQNLYRVRKGNTRIIFRKTDGQNAAILSVERRREDTYK